MIDIDDNDGLGDCHLQEAIGQASTSNMHIDVQRLDSQTVQIELSGSASNPLSLLGSAFGKIDWDLIIELETDELTGATSWDILGAHDGFPAYEIYINGTRIHKHDPGPAPYSIRQVLKLSGTLDIVFFDHDVLP